MYSKFFDISPDITYLNAASSGILPKSSATKAKEILEQLMRRGDIKVEDYLTLLNQTRQNIAKLINTETKNIGFINNTTSGVNIIKHTFPEIKHIIIFGKSFLCTEIPFLFDKRYRIEVQSDSIDILKKNLKQFKHSIVFVDLVNYLTGRIINIEEIIDIIHRYNSIIAIDAIQAIGYLPIDISMLDIDYLFAGSSKWLLGPKGLGFIYIKDQLIKKTGIKSSGWLSLDFKDFTELEQIPPLRNDASVVESGTLNLLGVAILNENLNIINSINIENIYEYNMKGMKKLLAELELIGEVTQSIYNVETPLVSLKCKNIKGLYNYLLSKNIIVSLRNEYIRFSYHFYNNEQDIYRTIKTIKNFNKK